VKKWSIFKENYKIMPFFSEKGKSRPFLVDQPKARGFGSTNDGVHAKRAFNFWRQCRAAVLSRCLTINTHAGGIKPKRTPLFFVPSFLGLRSSNFSDQATPSQQMVMLGEHFPILISNISGIDEQLITNLRTILICLSCQLPIAVPKFQAFCYRTAEITASVHTLSIHGSDIIENSVLPTGYFGEGPRKIFLNPSAHARKRGRAENLTDAFHRAPGTSVPIISSVNFDRRIQRRKIMCLPLEVLDPLECS